LVSTEIFDCKVADPDASKRIVLVTLFTVYVTVANGVPVKLIVAIDPEHMDKVGEEIVAVGSGET
jgi:phosphoribosylaminoimidazole (AIR) synthetase